MLPGYPPNESPTSVETRARDSAPSAEDNDYSTLTKLTRALMSLAGYDIPQDLPVDLSTSPCSELPTTLANLPSPFDDDDDDECDTEDRSPTPSPSKSNRPRPQTFPPSSIDWLPPPSSRSRFKVHNKVPPLRSTEVFLPNEDVDELVEWTEPRSCRAWRGQMKRVENRVMQVIAEEEEEDEEGDAREIRRRGSDTRGEEHEGRGRDRRKKRRQRKKLFTYLRVYRDERRSALSTTTDGKRGREEEEAVAGRIGVLEHIEGNNEQRKRRRRRKQTLVDPDYTSGSSASSAFFQFSNHPPSSPSEQEPTRKSFRDLEAEAQALERTDKGLVWIEETPELSTFEDDENEDDEGGDVMGALNEDGLDWSSWVRVGLARRASFLLHSCAMSK